MRTEELLALGVFGRGSRIGDRIARLLERGREFSPRVSKARVMLSAAAMVGLGMAGSFAPRFLAFAQEPARPPNQAPSFDVVSVKRSESNSAQFRMGSQPGGRFVAENASVEMLVQMAWEVRDHQIAGAPGWLDSDKFTIEAKPGATPVPGGLAGVAQIKEMIRSLLADRFKLATHRETRQEQIYELVVAKGGSKLKEAAAVAAGQDSGLRMGIGQVTGVSAGMPILSSTLSQFLRRSVVDRTGLSGNYKFTLKWTPDAGEFVPPGQDRAAAPADGPSIFTAVQEQLGLELRSAKGPVEMLVIDHVERPDEN